MLKILFLIFSISSVLAIDPPVSLKGQQSAAKLIPKWNVQVPGNQATNLGGIDALIETGNDNLLINPGFEHATVATGWSTAQTGSAVVSTAADATNYPEYGKKHIQLVCNGGGGAGTCSLFQDVTTTTTSQGSVYIRVKGEVAATSLYSYAVYTRINGTRTTNVIPGSNNGVFSFYKIPTTTGTSSTGIELVVTVASGISPNVIIDTAFVGADQSVQGSSGRPLNYYTSVSQAALLDSTGEIRFATTSPFTVSGDSSLITYSDDSANTRTKFIANTPLNAEVSFGTAITTTNASLSIFLNGTRYQSGSQIRTANDQSTVSASLHLNAGDYITFDAGTVVSTGAQVYAMITATPDATTSIYATNCSSDIACANEFTAKVSSAGTVSGENIDWINGNASIASTSQYTITFNTGVFSIAPNCLLTAENSSSISIDEFTLATITAITAKTYLTNTAAATVSNFTINCYKTGSDYIARKSIVGSFDYLVVVPNIKAPKECIEIFGGAGSLSAPTNCTGSPCTEYYDNCVSGSVTWTSTGLTTTTWAAGTWAANSPIECTANNSGAGTQYTSLNLTSYQTDASGGFALSQTGYSGAGTSATNGRGITKCKATSN